MSYYNQKIDFHSHYLSPTYCEYLSKYEDEKPDSFPTPKWNIKDHISLMDRLGIAFSLISVSSPNLSKADRVNGFSILMKQDRPDLPLDFKADMNHVYFDVAGFPLQKQLHALLKDVKIDNLVYGSDAPYTPNLACVALGGGLEKLSMLSKDEKNKIFTENGIALVPRIADILGIESNQKTVCYADTPLNAKEKFSRGVRSTISKLYGLIFQ